MSSWDLNIIRKLAGLPEQTPPAQLNEGWSDDSDDYGDDEDPDVRIADEDKGQKKFEKKNKKELKKADKEATELKAKKAPVKAEEKKVDAKKEEPKKAEPKKAEAPKAEPKKEEPKKEPEAKKDDGEEESKKKADEFWGALAKGEKKAPAKAKAEKEDKADDSDEEKKRGRAKNPESNEGKGESYLRARVTTMSRGEYLKWAKEHLGWNSGRASAHYFRIKAKLNDEAHANPRNPKRVKKVVELFTLHHPFAGSMLLAENREMNTMQWIDEDSKLLPYVFESLEEAERIAKYMQEWKGQTVVIEKHVFEEWVEVEGDDE